VSQQTDGSRQERTARDELREARAELRFELGAADVEVRESLREAIAEVRVALRDIFGSTEDREAEASRPGGMAATRLSRAERKELTRELLLDAAIEVFAQKGYHGASLDDVAEAAGFTKGAVYSNFTRKSDLFLALVERESSRRGAALTRAIDAVDVALLPELAAAWLARQGDESRDWDVLTVEFWLAAMRDPSVRRALCAGRDEALTQLGELLDAKLAATGSRPGLTGRQIAAILDALGTGLLMAQALETDAASAELFAAAVRKLLADAPATSGAATPPAATPPAATPPAARGQGPDSSG